MRPITRVSVDEDTGHSPYYNFAVAWSAAQFTQDDQNTGHSSSDTTPYGPYAGSGDVRVGEKGYGVHRQYDLREAHDPIPLSLQGSTPPVESPLTLDGAAFPWLETGSETVYINTQGCGRAGDRTFCGAVVKTGDDTVKVGD